MSFRVLEYPPSGTFAKDYFPHDAYGPDDSTDCSNDYGFGIQNLPKKPDGVTDNAAGYQSKHSQDRVCKSDNLTPSPQPNTFLKHKR
jgi:hypothetical protein